MKRREFLKTAGFIPMAISRRAVIAADTESKIFLIASTEVVGYEHGPGCGRWGRPVPGTMAQGFLDSPVAPPANGAYWTYDEHNFMIINLDSILSLDRGWVKATGRGAFSTRHHVIATRTGMVLASWAGVFGKKL